MSTADTSRPGRPSTFEAFLNFGSLVRGGRVTANWLPDGRFWFLDGPPDRISIKVMDTVSGQIQDLFDVARVREALASHLGRQLSGSGLPFNVVQVNGSKAAFSLEGETYVLDMDDYSIQTQPGPNQMEQIFGRSSAALAAPRMFTRPSYHAETFPGPEMPSPDGTRLVGLRDFNLALHYVEDGRTEMLTEDGEEYCSWDVESLRMGMAAGGSIVHRTTNPWSPTGFHLFASKFDKRRVPIQTRTHLLKRYDEVEEVRVPRTGDPIPTIAPYVVDVLKRSVIRIDVPTEDCFMLFLGWQADGRSLSFVLYSRDMRAAALYTADPRTGKVRLVYEERGETYVRIQHQVLWGRPGCSLLSDGSGFIWESERDGWNHLYLYDQEGRQQRQLTSGPWAVLDVLSIDEQRGEVYFSAHHDAARPYDVHLCRVPLAGGDVQRLTPHEGVHEIQLAPDFSSYVATRSLPHLPPRSEVHRRSGEAVHAFPAADVSRADELGWTLPEQFCVKAADGETDLWGVMFKPREFDPAKSYPVIEYIYGGPQIVNTPHNFHAPVNSPFGGLHCGLAQLGYVVVVLDARGTPERSKAFQDTSFKEWRRHVGNDHAAAIQALAQRHSWIDIERIGLWGHSWGGYHTAACLIDHPEVYRVGVASAPGFEPYDYFIYEPYFGGAPNPDNAAGYKDASLFGDVGRLMPGSLMIVAGSSDICPWQNAMKMTHALIKAGVDHEFVALPDELHGYGSRQEAYFIEKPVRHFDRRLKP